MAHPEFVSRCLPKRLSDSHKGTYGTLLSVCGSYGMAGAAMFAARAASRSGVGLVKAVLPASIYPMVAAAVPEAVFLPFEDEKTLLLPAADAVVVGCGLGQTETTLSLLKNVLSTADCPVVLDADGINLVAKHISIIQTIRTPRIFTPHPMKLARLLGVTAAEVQQNREAAAVTAAQKVGGIVVLKGHRTVVADQNGVLWVNTTGNAGMATAGMGDVLAGMIGGFLAQGVSLADAACGGVYLHGLAGDKAAARLSKRALLPTDVLEEMGTLFAEWE